MSKERFEVFGNVIKDNEDIPSLLNNYQATVRLNELNDKVKELEQELAELKEMDNYHLRYELAGADETIANLKKQLAEKDKEIKSLIADYEKRISQEQELMSNMEHRLVEKQNTIDEINKEFVQAVHDWKALCKKKDKEISKLQASCQQVKTQLAIQELEKVKEFALNNVSKFTNSNEYRANQNWRGLRPVNYYELQDFIDNQIKVLKGE